jgi:hypothetical protein
MNDQQRAAMQMALEALDNLIKYDFNIEPIDEFDIAGKQAITALREALAQSTNSCQNSTKLVETQPQGEHKTDGSPCWCNPEVTYENPETGAKVIVHREPQGCPHRIADARNPIVKSGYICVDCGALFSAADHEAPPIVPQGEPVAYAAMVNGEIAWDADYPFSNEPFTCFDDEQAVPLYPPEAIKAAIDATIDKVLSCYSPDDTAQDWADKIAAIRSMK